MTVQFNVLDYLTPDEIKDECKKAIQSSVKEMFAKDEAGIDRLICNLGYEFVFRAVSAAIGEDAREKIAAKVAELLQKDDAIKYEMWRRRDAWDRTESPAIGILDDSIKANRLLIFQKVQEAIRDYDFYDVNEAMYAAAQDVIRQRIFGGENDGHNA